MLQELIPLLIPLVLVQLTLQVIALINLKKKPKVRFDNKLIWVLVIVLGSFLGTIIYFLAGGASDEDGRID